jgi:hypothetical protein
LKQKNDDLLSNVAIKFNWRRYIEVLALYGLGDENNTQVGRCSLTLSNPR